MPALDAENKDEPIFHDGLGSAAIRDFLAQARAWPLTTTTHLLGRMLDEERLNPRDGWVDLGVTQALRRDLKAAASAFKKAIEAAPNGYHPEAHYHLGRVLVEDGVDLARAQSELELAASADPTDAAVQYYLGAAIRAYFEKESLEKARRAWKAYLDAGAPLGHRDEVEAFLAPAPTR